MTQSDQRTCGTAAAPRRNDHKNLAGVNRAGHRGPPNTAGQGARVITRTSCYVRSIGDRIRHTETSRFSGRQRGSPGPVGGPRRDGGSVQLGRPTEPDRRRKKLGTCTD